MDLVVGGQYVVDAVGTTSREKWTITKIEDNEKGVTLVTAKGSKTPHHRTFLPENFVQMEKKMEKKIVSESVEFVGTMNGYEVWVENTTHWPQQAKRGRKPKVAA